MATRKKTAWSIAKHKKSKKGAKTYSIVGGGLKATKTTKVSVAKKSLSARVKRALAKPGKKTIKITTRTVK